MTPAILALRRAAGALLVVADTRLAVLRALDGHGPMPSLATFADDRATAISALSEALRVAGDPPWPLHFADFPAALAVGAESGRHCETAATLCDTWAGLLEATAGSTPDAAA